MLLSAQTSTYFTTPVRDSIRNINTVCSFYPKVIMSRLTHVLNQSIAGQRHIGLISHCHTAIITVWRRVLRPRSRRLENTRKTDSPILCTKRGAARRARTFDIPADRARCIHRQSRVEGFIVETAAAVGDLFLMRFKSWF